MIDESRMTLARDWKGTPLFGWFFSEKIEDCRVVWDGASGEFWTRHGNIVPAPNWFKRGLPKCRVDGGIWAGRGNFQQASTAVRFGGHWFDDAPLRFVPFDHPEVSGTWDRRITEANRAVAGAQCADPLEFWTVKHYRDFVSLLKRIAPLGGEGVMFRNPEITSYETGRSANLLRLKFKKDQGGDDE